MLPMEGDKLLSPARLAHAGIQSAKLVSFVTPCFDIHSRSSSLASRSFLFPPYSNCGFSPQITKGILSWAANLIGIENIAICMGIPVAPFCSKEAIMNFFSTSGSIVKSI